jgi:hypothetical protein
VALSHAEKRTDKRKSSQPGRPVMKTDLAFRAPVLISVLTNSDSRPCRPYQFGLARLGSLMKEKRLTADRAIPEQP